MHHAFGKFLDDCDNVTPMQADYDLISKVSAHLRGFHADESHRKHKFNSIMNDYLGDRFKLSPAVLPHTAFTTDGHAIVDDRLLILAEAKQEVGATGAEPYVQASSYYLEWCRHATQNHKKSVMPCLLIVYFGNNLAL